MSAGRVEPELHALKRSAEQLAARTRDALSTAHLLAAISSGSSPLAELLSERHFTPQEILRLGRLVQDDLPDPTRVMLGRAHEIAVRMGLTQASSAHLLVALLNEPRSAARRALERGGADLGRLRSTAMQLGLGLMRGRRAPSQSLSHVSLAKSADSVGRVAPGSLPRSRSAPPAIKVPLIPKAATRRPPGRAAPVPSAPSNRGSSEDPTLARFELPLQKFPVLRGLGRNLTLAAARGDLDPVVGRDSCIEQLLDVLAKREGNNPCLMGSSGVGKTSVVRGLAQRIARGSSLLPQEDKILIEIPIGELLAGTGVRGALAQRVLAIRREVAQARGKVILFFDEIQQLFTVDGADEIASELKLALARGELPCIGATTPEGYQKSIGADAALARRFSLVEVEELNREEAYLVLDALKPRLESHHGVRYDDQALALSIAWSLRYLPGRALPDKAVSILDLAGARTRRRAQAGVESEMVAEIVADLADMPIERLLESDRDRLLRLEAILAERVVGHADSIHRIARILRRNAAGFGAKRPIGTFLLLGPSGVGKTETAKAIAEVLFHSESAMTRIDLSEYSEAHSIARLIGAPPGYVGHEAGGQLTEAVRRRPYQLILLDELEKAHPDVLTAFLALFDEGRLTDGRGRTVDFTNTVIVLTSNLGGGEVSSTRRRVGFGEREAGSDLEPRIVAAVRAALPPELYNRIDEVLVFGPLTRDELREIGHRLLSNLARRLFDQRGVQLKFGPELVEYLLDQGGFEPTLGARPMKRTIARLIEGPIAEQILGGELGSGSVVAAVLENTELHFEVLGVEPSARMVLPAPSAAE